ncbi:MAG: RsmE family RNA methyltransferase [Oligoflexus sp.]
MKHRFRFSGTALSDGLHDQHWRLSEDDAFHLQKVLRLSLGADVEVADGQGRWCIGTIVELTNRIVLVKAHQQFEDKAPALPLVLAIAAMKPASFEDLLPSLVELGVDKILIFAQVHTDRKWLSEKVESRWQRIIAAAMKQCKRAWQPELHIYKDLQSLLLSDKFETWNRYLLEPESEQVLFTSAMQPAASLLLIGSEKGLTEIEKNQLLAHNFQPVRLGTTILRAFTASLAATAVISAKRDSLLANQRS